MEVVAKTGRALPPPTSGTVVPFRMTAIVLLYLHALIPVGCAPEKSKPTADQAIESGTASDKTLDFTYRVPPTIGDDQPDMTVTVPVENTTSRRVTFERIIHSCSCVSAEYKTNSLAPGEKTTLEVTIRLVGRSGPQRFIVSLVDVDGRTWTYTVHTTIYPRARFSVENAVLQLPSTDPAKLIDTQVTLELFGATHECLPRAANFSSNNTGLTIQAGSPIAEQIAHGVWVRRIPVQLSYKTPSVPGAYHLRLLCSFEHAAQKHELSLGMSGQVRSLYEVTPNYLFFEKDTPADSTSKRVIIKRTDGRPLHIATVYASNPAVRVTVEGCTDPSMRILICTLDRKHLQEPLWGQLVVNTNHDQQPELRVQYAAMPKLPSKSQSSHEEP